MTTKKILFGFLLPSFIGSFSQKLFPISEVSNGTLQMQLYLEDKDKAVKITTVLNTFTFDRIRLHLSVIEYNETITTIIRNAYREMYIPCVSIHQLNHLWSVGTTVGTLSWTTSPNLLNAKGVCFVFRSSDTYTASTQYCLSARTSAGMKKKKCIFKNWYTKISTITKFDI